ncbi:MAG: ABC transporter substrate-binding protein [Actinomycetes bacterium]
MSHHIGVARALGVSFAVAALTLAACGDDGGGGGGQGGGASPAPTQQKDPALAAKVPDAIASDGTITIGVDASYAPNEFLAEDGKTVKGFDVDLFDAVAQKLGLKTEWSPAPFDAIIPGVDSGKYEIGVSSFTINPERKQTVNMVSYFSAGTQWATKKGNPEGVAPDDACGKKIAVQRGTVQATEDLPVRQEECSSAGKSGIAVDQYQQQDQATAAIVSGKDAAMLADSPIVAYAVEQTGGQLETLGEIYDAAPYGYVVPKDQTEFAEVLAEAVQSLIDDGPYQKVLDEWGVSQGAVETSEVNP